MLFIAQLHARAMETAFCGSGAAVWTGQRRASGVCVRRRAPTPRACAQGKKVAAAAAPVLTVDEVMSVAERQGFRVEKFMSGPVLKLDLFKEEDILTAYITGCVLPNGRLHIESYKAMKKEDGALLSVTPGMLVFMGALAFGCAQGCKEVYGLAIRDENRQHRRLRRYLKRFGGVEVKQLTAKVAHIPEKLLYGGEGTIIKGNIEKMLKRSKRMLDRMTWHESTSPEKLTKEEAE